MRRSLVTAAATIGAIWLAGCGTATTPARRAELRLTACLQAAALHPTHARVGGPISERITDLDGAPRPISIESADGVAILGYRSPRQAAAEFNLEEQLAPVLAQGNTALVVESDFTQPTAKAMRMIEHCAFSDPHRARIGGAVTDVRFTVPAHQPHCRLTAAYEGSSAGAGVYFGDFSVHNRARSRCALYRYPKLTMFYGAGHPLPEPQSDGNSGVLPTEPFMPYLEGHQTTYFAITFVLSENGQACSRADATSVLITVGPDASARATLAPPYSKERQPLGECPGLGVGTFGRL
jgi:hypothetical protein